MHKLSSTCVYSVFEFCNVCMYNHWLRYNSTAYNEQFLDVPGHALDILGQCTFTCRSILEVCLGWNMYLEIPEYSEYLNIFMYNPGTVPGVYLSTWESQDTWTWSVCMHVCTILGQSQECILVLGNTGILSHGVYVCMCVPSWDSPRSVLRYLGILGYLDMECVCVYHPGTVPGVYLGTWESRDTWTCACVYHPGTVPGVYLGTWESRDTWTWSVHVCTILGQSQGVYLGTWESQYT